jgi:two-component system NtrC family response regulator
MTAPKILVVDDDASFRRVLEYQLKEAGYSVACAADGKKALDLFFEHPFDAVLTDLDMPQLSGNELLRQIKKQSPDIPVIVITGFATVDSAVDAMKAGAFHYLTKPLNRDALLHTLRNALEFAGLVSENRNLREAVSEAFKFQGIVGSAPKMRRLIEQATQLARVDTTVLISGESGTGKEVLAKAIHFNSARNGRPFVVINCGAIPESLLESELFGYRKGAFTGAVDSKAGKFETTVFLDEIGDLPLSLQVKVLRVVQENEIDIVGGNKSRKIDVRILAASNRDLRQMAGEGQFRQDLYYRLNVAPLHVPALRDRKEDIPLLIRFFIERICKRYGRPQPAFGKGVLEKMTWYGWPGNVRELENTIERLVVFSQNREIEVNDLPDEILNPQLTVGNVVLHIPPEGVSMAQVEKELVLTALERNQWNQTRAASFLQISRNVLIYRMQKYRMGPYKDMPMDAPVLAEDEDDPSLPANPNPSSNNSDD